MNLSRGHILSSNVDSLDVFFVCNKFFLTDSFGFSLSFLLLFMSSTLPSETTYVDVTCNLCWIENWFICTLKCGFRINGIKDNKKHSTTRKLLLFF